MGLLFLSRALYFSLRIYFLGDIMKSENKDNKEKKQGNSVAKKILTAVGILLIIIGIVLMGKYVADSKKAKDDTEVISTAVMTTETLADNPIDFASLKETNDEIYAWLNVPGTKVDYPVLQSKESDDFYLKHSATDKSYSASGAVYTQSMNETDFSDRVTVIYGHNGYGDTFFTTLHNFENEDTFNSNPNFTIYTPGRKLTYEIVSAFKYDDRHIMNSFNFKDDDVYKDFLSMIQNPSSAVKNVRTLDRELTTDDKIVVLSTCITNQKSNRYLVCGVLINDEKTN